MRKISLVWILTLASLLMTDAHARREMLTPEQKQLLRKADLVRVDALALTDKGEVDATQIVAVVSRRMRELEYTIVLDREQPHDVVFRVKCEQRKVWEGTITSGGDADLPDAPSRVWQGPACQLSYLLKGRNMGWRKEVRTDFQDSVKAAAEAGAQDPGAYALTKLIEKLEAYDFAVLISAEWSQTDRLFKLLDAPSTTDTRKIRIITMLGNMFDASAVPRLVRATDDPNLAIAQAATVSLGEIGKTETLPLLLDLLKSDKPELQAASAAALGQIGALNFDYSMVDPLLETLERTDDIRVKTAVVLALGKLPDKRSYETLSQLDQDLRASPVAKDDPEVAELKRAVAWSLRQIQPAAHTYE